MQISDLIFQQLYSFVTLVLLLLVSAMVSGSETILFSLTHHDRARVRERSERIGRLAEYILGRPEQLLLTIMVANMAVNALIFTMSSLLVYRFVKAGHSVFGSGIGIGTLLALIVFGEILSKACMYHLRVPASILVTGPVYVLMRVLRVPLLVVEKVFIVPMVRLVVGSTREAKLSKNELLALFSVSGQDGYLQPAQVELLEKVIALRDLRVWQVMVPRVNMPAIEIHESTEALRELIRRTHRSRVAVYVYDIDYIVGMVRSRRVLAEQPKYLRDTLERVKFVPENQRVDQLLHFFHRENIDVAMVVDEYGGLVGMVSLEELMERTIGELGLEFPDPDAPKLLVLGADQYLADGHFPRPVLFEQLKLPVPQAGMDTVAGFVMHLAGHLPEKGDTLVYRNLRFVVREVNANWVEQVLVESQRKAHDRR